MKGVHRNFGSLSLIFSHPNISDGNFILVPNFNCTQIFQLDFWRRKRTYFDFPFHFTAKCKKKGTSWIWSNISPKKRVHRYLQNTIFNFKLKFHSEDGLIEQRYFELFFLGMVYIFILQKIAAQRGRLHPFLRML